MKFLVPSVLGFGCCIALGVALAQSSNPSNANMPQLPVGQVFKDFAFPYYQKGQIAYVLAAREAKGITQNRAETADLKIDIYDQGKVTTTITSPKADLYINDRKMRTKDTVLITRSDLEASAQVCDFDLLTKKYILRENVKVTLKNFGPGIASGSGSALPSPVPVTPSLPAPASTSIQPASPLSFAPNPAAHNTSPVDTSGTYTQTNAAPIAPPVTP